MRCSPLFQDIITQMCISNTLVWNATLAITRNAIGSEPGAQTEISVDHSSSSGQFSGKYPYIDIKRHVTVRLFMSLFLVILINTFEFHH